MTSRKIFEYIDDGILYMGFHGFYDYKEFDEVIRTLREDIKVDSSKFSGITDMDGYSIKDSIRINWRFNNWDCIEMQYDNPSNQEAVEKIREWTRIIFDNLMKKFGEDSN